MAGGGKSSSDSSSEQVYTDKRVVGRDGAQVSGDSNTVYVSSTDHEAVLRGTEVARQALTLAGDTGRTAAALTLGMFSSASESQGAALKQVSSAYETAREGDQKMVKVAALGVVAVVAVAAVMGKK